MKSQITGKKSSASHENISLKEHDFTKPRSLVIQIFRELQKAIATNQLIPGQVLIETELQEWFGVSRAPIREAIRLLEAENLVVVNGYKKKYVRRITLEYLRNIIPVNSCLEACAAGLAVKLMTDKQIDYLKKVNNNMKHAYDNKEYAKCNEINFEFHKTFISAANNKALKKAIKAIDRGVTKIWLTDYYFSDKKVILKSINDHKKVIHGFVKRDIIGVQKAVREHVTNILNLLLKNSNFDSEGNIIIRNMQ